MKRKKFGFTLIELMVVMAIVSILMAMALVSYQGARKSAMDGKRKADLEQIRSALEMCYSDDGVYPAAIYPNIVSVVEGKIYFTGTPGDPITQANYYYSRPTVNTYTLCALVSVGGTADCGIAGFCDSQGTRCNYKVTNP